jgi:acetoacetyl-CoA synthetase
VPESLSALRTILSTGAPLPAESYDFVRAAFGEHIQLCSISGGTDIISCFALGNPLLPVFRGELQCLGLGMAVEIYDEEGRSIKAQSGELVCTRPFPSMPLYFWNDGGEEYEAAYFKRFPGVWAHGDFAEMTPHGGLKIHGRSDAVVNPGGVRIGTAEICEPAMSLHEVLDAIAVGQRVGSDERVILFVVMRDGQELTDKLREKISTGIRVSSSPRHVPAEILSVPEIPRTISGKPVELAVRAVINGSPVSNLDALANPEALEHFRIAAKTTPTGST